MKPITEMTFWIACFAYIATPIETARILAIIPLPSYSHQIPYRLLWTTLSRRGHEIIVLTTDPINDPSLTNLTEINFKSNYKLIKKLNFIEYMEYSHTWLDILRKQLWPLCHEITENIYKHPEVRKMYEPNSDTKFDVVIVETIKSPSMYALAYRFNAPLIGVSTFGLYNHNYYLLGAPVLPSHSSAWEMEDTVFNQSLWQRIKNFIRQWYHIYCTLNHYYSKQQAIAEKYLGKNIPDISDIERNISFVFHNQRETLSFVRPRTPNVMSFGNFHISRKPIALPKNLNEFITDAPNGFIYMSLGTNVRFSSLSEHIQSTFRDVFASLPYKILWKHDSELPNKPDNIFIAKWFPQQSILAHPNIKLFIYQGGLQSTEEAVYYTVPLLGLPVLADQYSQIKKMVSLGVAKYLNIIDISRENLNESIIDILYDEGYKKRMLKVKALNEDKPYDILEHVIWWIEFIIRHKGASHLRTNIGHDPWYQRHDMDVIAILSIIIFTTLICTLVAIYKLLKIIFNLTKIIVITKKKID